MKRYSKNALARTYRKRLVRQAGSVSRIDDYDDRGLQIMASFVDRIPRSLRSRIGDVPKQPKPGTGRSLRSFSDLMYLEYGSQVSRFKLLYDDFPILSYIKKAVSSAPETSWVNAACELEEEPYTIDVKIVDEPGTLTHSDGRVTLQT